MPPDPHTDVRYQPDDRPPRLLSAGLGAQLALLSITGIVLTPAIVVRAAGGSDLYLQWAVFAAVLISGTTTIIQSVRLGRIGAGYILLMGSSGAFIAVCITAIADAGPDTMASLIMVTALLQFFLAARLRLFRRILTPTVSGTVIMLIPVTVMPIIFDVLNDVPETLPAVAAPLSAAVTIAVIALIALKATGVLRLWAPVAGVVAGSCVAGFFGGYDTTSLKDAAWFGIPLAGWPGVDLTFEQKFWVLLPTFLFLTLIGIIETLGDSIAIQRVSWRKPRAVDFQSVQGAIAADGTGNLLSGLLGTTPNTTYSSSIAMAELTGVAARSVGVAVGAIFLVAAFVPKGLAVVLAIPGPVVGAYLAVLMAILFVLGMKVVIGGGLDYRAGIVVSLSFWIGVGFEQDMIFPEIFDVLMGGLLSNGMTSGGLCAIALTLLQDLMGPRKRSIELTLDDGTLPKVQRFIQNFARQFRWPESAVLRMQGAAEEILILLTEESDLPPSEKMLLTASREDDSAWLEFIGSAGTANVQDRITFLGKEVNFQSTEQELTLRLLHHLTQSVRHERYHDVQIISVRVGITA